MTSNIMTSNSTSPSPGEPEKCEDFVVALPHAPDVVDRMRDRLRVRCTTEDSSPLNLTLVKPDWLAESGIGQRLRAEADKRYGRPGNEAILQIVRRPEGNPTPLDDLMFCLRYDYADEAGGWAPSMGKNRTIHNVTGEPHVDPGSVRYPVPAKADQMGAKADPSLGTGVRVGILDTRLYPHDRLAGRYFSGPDDLLATDQKVYSHTVGHATFIAGLINMRAPAAELDVRHVLDDVNATATVWDVARKMIEFKDSGVQILNVSLGCFTGDGEPPMVLARAVRVLSPDIVIVAAAGNHGIAAENRPGVTPQSAFWPAALDDVQAVGAVALDGGPEVAAFSPRLPWVTFTAEGEDVVSTYLTGQVRVPEQGEVLFEGYAMWSGTSFATAIVSGQLAALTKPGASAWPEVATLRKQAEYEP
jgi:membrane-anchored mycosin MYCP